MVVVGAAAWVIWRQISDISWSALGGALVATSPFAVAGSLVLSAGSYACLSLTEWLSARSLGHAIGLGQAARVAVPAYALTNTAGFSPVTGAALRLQLYRRLGLSTKSAAAVAMVAGAAVTLSGLVVLGACLALDPGTAARAVHGPRWATMIAAAVLMAPAALWFVALSPGAPRWLGRRRGPSMDGRRRALGLAAGVGDWLFSGLALFVLLQTPHIGAFAAFLAAYVAGCLLSAATGVPGGIGVFEAIVLGLTSLVSEVHETAAALLIYRCLYSLLPLALVGVIALTRACGQRRRRAGRNRDARS